MKIDFFCGAKVLRRWEKKSLRQQNPDPGGKFCSQFDFPQVQLHPFWFVGWVHCTMKKAKKSNIINWFLYLPQFDLLERDFWLNYFPGSRWNTGLRYHSDLKHESCINAIFLAQQEHNVKWLFYPWKTAPMTNWNWISISFSDGEIITVDGAEKLRRENGYNLKPSPPISAVAIKRSLF